MKVQVECHSGHIYPERPVALKFENERLEILEIISEWREPSGRHFRVRLSGEREIELAYDENNDEWEAAGIV